MIVKTLLLTTYRSQTGMIIAVAVVILASGALWLFWAELPIGSAKYWFRNPINWGECVEAHRVIPETTHGSCEYRGAVFPAPESRSNAPDTSNWKTYRNEKYRYEIKYPQGWSVETDRGKYSLRAGPDTVVIGDATHLVVVDIQDDNRLKNSVQLNTPFAGEQALLTGVDFGRAFIFYHNDLLFTAGFDEEGDLSRAVVNTLRFYK